MNDDYLSVPEVIELTGLTQSYLSRLCRTKVFPNAKKFSGVWCIPKEDVKKLIEDRREETLSDMQKYEEILEKLKDV